MAKPITLPDLGDGIEGGNIINILVNVGDIVNNDDPILEIETDKATVEVPSPESGIVKEILVKIGSHLGIGDQILTLDSKNGSAEVMEKKQDISISIEKVGQEKEVSKENSTILSVLEVTIPDLGDGIESGNILSVLVKEGTFIKIDDPVLEIETDKATIEIPSTAEGKVLKVLIKTGEIAKIGQRIFTIEGDFAEVKKVIVDQKSPSTLPKMEKVKDVPKVGKLVQTKPIAYKSLGEKKLVPAAPSVRRFAREIGVSIYEVKGTGKGSRISLDDVKVHSKNLHLNNIEGADSSFKKKIHLPDFKNVGPTREESLSTIRAKTAKHMDFCWSTIPHVTQFDKADITDVELLRKKFKPLIEADGAKLTLTAILLKISAIALKKFPMFCSSLDTNKQKLIYKDYCNIGIAVATERGLLVPVIKDADKKNISELAQDLTDISVRARKRKITPADLQGGCFTITNLGGIAGTGFTPIVNWPEVAILGVSKSEIEPKYINEEFVPRLMMPLSLSYDHRVIDGANAAEFLKFIVSMLEDPFVMSLKG